MRRRTSDRPGSGSTSPRRSSRRITVEFSRAASTGTVLRSQLIFRCGRKRLANILVVDDDRNIRRMVAATLDTAGHRVIEADSAEQALKLLPESTADLVLSDVRMAGINGFGLLTELKRLNP